MTDHAFIWAQGAKANVKEPIEILKQQGWKASDVPAASNFNWIFRKITDDINTLNQEMLKLNQTLSQDIAKLKDKADLLYRSTKVLEFFINQSLRNDHFNHGISRQICEMLTHMEEQIKTFYPNYQPMKWPLNNTETLDAPSQINNIFNNIDSIEKTLKEEEG